MVTDKVAIALTLQYMTSTKGQSNTGGEHTQWQILLDFFLAHPCVLLDNQDSVKKNINTILQSLPAPKEVLLYM